LTHLGGPLNSQPKYHNNYNNNNINNINNSNIYINNSFNSSINEQNNNKNNTKIKQSQSPLQQYANLLLMQR
jgi:hypothetical protein